MSCAVATERTTHQEGVLRAPEMLGLRRYVSTWVVIGSLTVGGPWAWLSVPLSQQADKTPAVLQDLKC